MVANIQTMTVPASSRHSALYCECSTFRHCKQTTKRWQRRLQTCTAFIPVNALLFDTASKHPDDNSTGFKPVQHCLQGMLYFSLGLANIQAMTAPASNTVLSLMWMMYLLGANIQTMTASASSSHYTLYVNGAFFDNASKHPNDDSAAFNAVLFDITSKQPNDGSAGFKPILQPSLWILGFFDNTSKHPKDDSTGFQHILRLPLWMLHFSTVQANIQTTTVSGSNPNCTKHERIVKAEAVMGQR